MPKLYIKEGVNKGCYYDLNPKGETVIGRSSSCDIKLKDLDASRRHAQVGVTPEGAIVIRDLDSKNGTFINERRVTEARLGQDDTIRIGNTLCVIVDIPQDGAVPGAQKPSSEDGTEHRETLLSVKAYSDDSDSGSGSDMGSTVPKYGGTVPKKEQPSVQNSKDPSGKTMMDPQAPKHQMKKGDGGWEKIEGGATIVNLKREDLNSFGLSGISRKSKSKEPSSGGQTVDSTVQTMIDLKSSSSLLKQKEIEDLNQLKKTHNYLSILYEVANTICSNLDLEVVLNSIMKMVFRVLSPDRGFILLYDEETDELEPKVYLTKSGKTDKSEVTYSRSIIQQAIEQDAAILSSDASQDERFSGTQSIINYNIRSAMCVPLKYKEKLMGVLQVDNRLASGAFKENDLELLTSICNLASMAIENAKLYKNIQEETRRRSDYERFLSPNVVDQVMQGQVQLTESGTVGEVTILFSDIRSFTSMSERMEPEALVTQLNEYFSEMSNCIFDYEGTIDKFIGDAIMSVFGTPYPRQDDAVRAVKCAIAMQQRLVALNDRWVEEERPIFEVGIGINTGEVMLGNIGSERRMEFTVIGDPVNVAARLCGKAAAGEILISEFNYPVLKDHFDLESMGQVSLKGKEQAVKLYKVIY